ncbi:MAG: DinB family protein [Candidatus Acidiferrales bacterium]
MKDRMKGIAELLHRSHTSLLETCKAFPEERWRDAPRTGAWSAAEIIGHLASVEEAILGGMNQVASKPAVAIPIWKQFHLPSRLAAWRGFKVKTPIPLDPKLVFDKPPAIERLKSTRRATLQFLEDNKGRDLKRYRFPHPFFGSLNLYDWLRVTSYHEVRHTKQLGDLVEMFHS